MLRSQFSDRDQQRLRRELSLVENLTRMRRGANKRASKTVDVYYARGKSEFFSIYLPSTEAGIPYCAGGNDCCRLDNPCGLGEGDCDEV